MFDSLHSLVAYMRASAQLDNHDNDPVPPEVKPEWKAEDFGEPSGYA